jgi:protoporphyrinogen oxidase
MAGRVLPRNDDLGRSETFASVLEKGLGRTICRDFYFPYARKLWGLDPGELSAVQAHRRVSGGSLSKMVRKVLSAMPGRNTQGSGRFFYPLSGFGGISEVYHKDALDKRANVYLNAVVESLHIREQGGFSVYYEREGRHHTLQADHVWSTIPITALAGMMQPSPPAEIIDAAGNIDYRAMLLVYLVLDTGKFSEYDAHYFPEESIKITRLSEPKNYSGVCQPQDRTVLCAELPCSPDSPEWSKSEEELGDMVRDSLATAGIPLDASVLQVYVRRLRYAYPIYTRGYEDSFDKLDDWIGHIPHLLTFGRQGLFAHDNTHHAIYMAYCAVDCFNEDGVFDREGWGRYRKNFETHVVED